MNNESMAAGAMVEVVQSLIQQGAEVNHKNEV